jgi:hypothetical protein
MKYWRKYGRPNQTRRAEFRRTSPRKSIGAPIEFRGAATKFVSVAKGATACVGMAIRAAAIS